MTFFYTRTYLVHYTKIHVITFMDSKNWSLMLDFAFWLIIFNILSFFCSYLESLGVLFLSSLNFCEVICITWGMIFFWVNEAFKFLLNQIYHSMICYVIVLLWVENFLFEKIRALRMLKFIELTNIL